MWISKSRLHEMLDEAKKEGMCIGEDKGFDRGIARGYKLGWDNRQTVENSKSYISDNLTRAEEYQIQEFLSNE